MARLGRDLELFVANLESFLRGTDLVMCPEYLIAREAEGPQEIDITVRGCRDGRDVFVIFACRDRLRPQGRNWFREVSAARAEFGATDVVAVSSSGFTEPAKALAKRLGVDLRTVRQLTGPAALLPWIAPTATHTIIRSGARFVQMKWVAFEFARFPDPVPVATAVVAKINGRHRIDAPLFVRTSDGSSASLQDLANVAARSPELVLNNQPRPGLSLQELADALNGQVVTVKMKFPAASDRFAVDTPLGRIDMIEAHFTVLLRLSTTSAVRIATTEFSSDSAGELAQSVTFEIELPSGPALFDVHRKRGPTDQPQTLGMVVRPKAAPPKPAGATPRRRRR